MPHGFAYLWHWFLDLHTRRGSGAMGPAGISWTALDAWTRLTGADPSPWELQVIGLLDSAFFESTQAETPAKGR